MIPNGSHIPVPDAEATGPDAALDPSDTTLLVAVSRRDREALAELYRRHGDAVYAAACAVCGPQQAEEATRQVFVRLWWGQDPVDCDRRSLRSHLLVQAYRRATSLRRSDPCPVTNDLSDREGLAVVVSRFSGCTYREVARLLGVSERQARRAMRDGLRRLGAAAVGATAGLR